MNTDNTAGSAPFQAHSKSQYKRLAAQGAEVLPPEAAAPAVPKEAGQSDAVEAMRARKDAAYEERNKVVAALAKLFPSGIARTAIEGWSDDWHGCVYIDLPTGQVSWHFHDSQAHLFDGLPPYTKPWDGHDTPEKYRRLAALPPSSGAVVSDEREAFEKWAKPRVEEMCSEPFTREVYPDGDYDHAWVRMMWAVWQARAALQAPSPEAGESEPLSQEDAHLLAVSVGAVAYSPPPLRAVRGVSFTFEQLQAFVAALPVHPQPKPSEPVEELRELLARDDVAGRFTKVQDYRYMLLNHIQRMAQPQPSGDRQEGNQQ